MKTSRQTSKKQQNEFTPLNTKHDEGVLKSLCGMIMDSRKTASLSIIHGMSE